MAEPDSGGTASSVEVPSQSRDTYRVKPRDQQGLRITQGVLESLIDDLLNRALRVRMFAADREDARATHRTVNIQQRKRF